MATPPVTMLMTPDIFFCQAHKSPRVVAPHHVPPSQPERQIFLRQPRGKSPTTGAAGHIFGYVNGSQARSFVFVSESVKNGKEISEL